jgi:hypothetical protein
MAGVDARRTMKVGTYRSSGQGDRVNPAVMGPCKRLVPGDHESRVPTKLLVLQT